MGKVRDHITNDADAIAQWVKRKLVNHNPMSVRDKKTSSLKFTDGAAAWGDISVEHTEQTNEVIYGLKDGRQFKITVEEMDAHRDPVQAEETTLLGRAAAKAKQSTPVTEDIPDFTVPVSTDNDDD